MLWMPDRVGHDDRDITTGEWGSPIKSGKTAEVETRLRFLPSHSH